MPIFQNSGVFLHFCHHEMRHMYTWEVGSNPTSELKELSTGLFCLVETESQCVEVSCQGESESESRSLMSDSVRPHGIQSMEFSRPEYCSGWPFPSPGDLPNPGIEPGSSALQEDSLLNYQGLTRYKFIVASFCFHFSESYSLVNSLII